MLHEGVDMGISWVVIHSISVTVSRENTKNLLWSAREKILFIVSEHFSKIYC
jgi:hypothetical protein